VAEIPKEEIMRRVFLTCALLLPVFAPLSYAQQPETRSGPVQTVYEARPDNITCKVPPKGSQNPNMECQPEAVGKFSAPYGWGIATCTIPHEDVAKTTCTIFWASED
jgi:hypothetical protein